MDEELARDPGMVAGLAAQIGLQLRWPEAYRAYHDAAFAEDGATITGLSGVDIADADLQRYAQRFFNTNARRVSVRQLLQLTESVGTEPVEDERLPAAVTRETNRERFTMHLLQLGFHYGRGTNRVFYHAQRPGMRFVL